MVTRDRHSVDPVEGPRPTDAPPRAPQPTTGPPLRKDCLDAWDELWRSPIADLFEWSDIDALRRLWTFKSAGLHLHEKALRSPEVEGSTGQMRANPLFTVAEKYFDRVDALEANLALTVKARFDLRVHVEVTRKEAAALGEFSGLVQHVVEDRHQQPRLELVEGSAAG